MKKSVLIASLLFLSLCGFAQQVWTYQPGPQQGKDAFIYTLESDESFGDHPNFMASAWTNGGEFVVVRCLIDILPENVPDNIEILDAKLSLYSYDSPSNGAHSTASGSNACFLRRIVEPWSENSVTWFTQPETTTENQVVLDASSFSIQDYEDIDITAMVQDMIESDDQGRGIMIRLQTEDIYRAMVFGSSDNDDPELRPKVVITYESTLSMDDQDELEFNLFPNPAESWVRLELPGDQTGELRIWDNSGRVILSEIFQGRSQVEVDISDLSNGIYFVESITESGQGVEKLVIAR
jgi:hypothetical protein